MLKQRKNKTFNYNPRFSQDGKKNTVENESDTKDFISKWQRERGRKRKVGFSKSIRTLIIILVLLLLGMYMLDSKFR